jgi:carboxyl-terminal processing protease
MVHRSGIMDDDRFNAPGGRDASASPAQQGSTPPYPSAGVPAAPTPAPPGQAWGSTTTQPRRPNDPIAGWTPPTPAGWEGSGPTRGRRLLAVTIVVLVALVVFSLGVSVGQTGLASTPGAGPSYSPSAGAPDWRLLDEAYGLLDQHFVDRAGLDPLALERGAVVGMTESLDDRGHTGYLTPDEVAARDDSLSGTFVGVGAVLDQQDGAVRIVRVLRDSPAERAGLKAGEEIVTVDGASVADLTIDEVVSKVRGIEGTEVALELRDPDGTTRTLTITREKLDLPLASWAFVPGTKDAVLRLESFSAGAGKATTAALREALDQGAQGIVLDLRGNPGGYVNEPVEVASQLLADGVVYLSVDRSGTQTAHDVKGGGIATDIPLVVLVDDQTASSAEILTGAVQDAGRGTVVGVTTYGTGTVVSTFPLQDGGALTIGTERWLTPKGRAIWREGLVPDEVVELPAGAALVVPDDLAALGAGGIAGTGDAQLKAALAALGRAQAGAGKAFDRAA